jgi:elongation factor P
MDTTTYDQTPISAEQIGDGVRWLKENATLTLLTHEERLLGVELPMSVELEVTETEPGFRGDTANAGTKPATVETGAIVDVPLFVNPGDRIRIDTRNGRYLERA